jgi:hypothetical protein
MHCSEFEARLNELLDRRIAPDDDGALCSHARRCPECADSMAAHLALTAALKDFPPELPDETFRFAVMNRWESEHNNSGATGNRSLPVLNFEKTEAFNSLPHSHGQTSFARASRQRQWLLTALVTAASLFLAFTLWRSFNPNPPAPATSNIADYDRLAEETQQLAAVIATRQLEMMNDFAEGIKPVASSFGAAYDALRRTLPASNAEPNASSG